MHRYELTILLLLFVLFCSCRIMEVMDGKGGGPKGRVQGKVSKLEKRDEAEKLLRSYIKEQLK